MRRRGHFQKLKKRQVQEQTGDIIPEEDDLPINLEAPIMEEIKKASITLKNEKATGLDCIPTEAMQAA